VPFSLNLSFPPFVSLPCVSPFFFSLGIKFAGSHQFAGSCGRLNFKLPVTFFLQLATYASETFTFGDFQNQG
jgi:hypothetical protein